MPSWRIANDPEPENPNPHAWDLSGIAFPSEESAVHFASSEWEDLAREYGDDYANDSYRYLIVHDTRIEPTRLNGEPPLSDSDALDRLNRMLSAPEWSVSMLEDACAIVRATGREEIAAAEWPRH